jgi:hypothetical protein
MALCNQLKTKFTDSRLLDAMLNKALAPALEEPA